MVFGWGKKKRDEASQTTYQDLKLSDVLATIDDINKEQSEHLVTQAKKIWDPIAQHIEDLLRIAIQLEKDQINTENIDINIVTIVKRGKKQVLSTIHKESKRNFSPITSVDDVKEFHRQALQTLTRIGDVLGKQTKVIHIFAKKYAGKLKEILEKYTEDHAHLTRLLNKYLTFEENYGKVVELLDLLKKENEITQTYIKKITSMNQNISKLDIDAVSLDKKISEFKSSPNYIRYQELQHKLGNLDSKKSQIGNQINNQTILISRPISKYEYVSALDKEQKILVEKFLASPFEVFLLKNKDALATILDNIKKAISLKHMSVKEPEKTISYIDDIKNKLDGFIDAVESFHAEYHDLREQLHGLDLQVLENYEKQHSKTHENIDFSKSRIQELQAEVDYLAPNKSRHISDIESILNSIGHTRYSLKE